MTEYEKQSEDWVGAMTGVVLFLAAILFAVAMLVGCDQLRNEQPKPPPPTSSFTLPDGLPTDRTVIVEQETHAASTRETAKGTGAGLTASGDKASIGDFKSTAPTAGAASGGSTSGDLSAIAGGGGRFGLFAVGGIFLAASAFGVYRRWPIRAVVGLGGCGAACIVAALLPGWAVLILAAAGLIAAVCWLWSEHAGNAANEGLRAVVAGVGDLPTDAQDLAKAKIKSHASEADKRTIRKVKFADNIP